MQDEWAECLAEMFHLTPLSYGINEPSLLLWRCSETGHRDFLKKPPVVRFPVELVPKILEACPFSSSPLRVC